MRLIACTAVLLAACTLLSAAAVDWDKETNALLDRALDSNPFVALPAQDEIRAVGRPCVPALRAALKHEKASRRYFACEFLGDIHDPSAVADLVPLLEDLKEEQTGEVVAAAAARALGKLGDPSVGPKLIEKLDSTNAELRYEAAKSLGLLRVSEAGPKLLELLKKKDVGDSFGGGLLKAATAEALGRIRHEAAIADIGALLDDPVAEPRSGWTMQEIAVHALERISGETKGSVQGEEQKKTVEAWKKWLADKAPKDSEKPVEPPKEPETPK